MSTFGKAFLALGLLVQVIAYLVAPSHPISLISGMLGIVSVVLTSQGNIKTFFFGIAQIVTYMVLLWMNQLWAGLAINVFYLLSQLYGIWAWRRNIKAGSTAETSTDQYIHPKRLSPTALCGVVVLTLIASLTTGWLLSLYSNDSQPYLDALTTVPGITATLLTLSVYREGWWVWLCVHTGFIILWTVAGNWSMVAQYVFWWVNCIYGMRQWQRLSAN